MKVKFTVQLFDKTFEEVVEINENKIKGEGYQSRNAMYNILSNWVDAVVDSSYQIIEDERFNEEENNIPYIDYKTAERFGWLK